MMDKGQAFVFGFGFALMIGSVILVALIILKTRGDNSAGRYDERQVIARGRAFKYAFFAALIYYLIYCCILIYIDDKWLQMICTGLGLFVSVTVFAVNAIWNDAYVSFREKSGSYLTIFLVLLAVNLIPVICKLFTREPMEITMMNLFGALMAAVILMTMALKRRRDRDTEDSE